jgi:hypothetical protein
MEEDTAAHVTAKLEDAIDKVLEGTATLARQFSKLHSEEYVRILAPARIAIYVTLQAIYADRPDLRPEDDAPEGNDGEALVTPEVPEIERAQDGEVVQSVKSLFRDAHRLLNEARVEIRFATGIRLPAHEAGLPTLDSAADAIQEALARLGT